MNGVRVVRTVTLREDVGNSFPVFRRTELVLWSDGTVTWAMSGDDRPEAAHGEAEVERHG